MQYVEDQIRGGGEEEEEDGNVEWGAVHPEVKYVRYWEARHAAPSFSKKK